MGWRFRRSIRVAPGIRLNLSKGGVSASIGGKGATLNIGKRGPHFPRDGNPEEARAHLEAAGAEGDMLKALDAAELDWVSY